LVQGGQVRAPRTLGPCCAHGHDFARHIAAITPPTLTIAYVHPSPRPPKPVSTQARVHPSPRNRAPRHWIPPSSTAAAGPACRATGSLFFFLGSVDAGIPRRVRRLRFILQTLILKLYLPPVLTPQPFTPRSQTLILQLKVLHSKSYIPNPKPQTFDPQTQTLILNPKPLTPFPIPSPCLTPYTQTPAPILTPLRACCPYTLHPDPTPMFTPLPACWSTSTGGGA